MRFGLPFLSAALLWLSFPPVNLWPLAWIALVPWFVYLLEEPKAWRALLVSYASGFCFFTIGFGWLRHVAIIAPPACGLVFGLHWLLFAVAVRQLRAPRLLAWPVAWILLEWLRGSTPHVRMPWFNLGHTQIYFYPLAQCADLAGVPLISALMIAMNALLVDAVRQRRAFIPDAAWRRSAIGWGAAFAAVLAYGGLRAATLETEPGPTLLLVQPNIPQDRKEIVLKLQGTREERMKWMNEIYERDLRLTREGMSRQSTRPDLIVWPEAAVVHPVYVEGGELTVNRRLATGPAREHRTDFLIGLLLYELEADPVRNFNSALLVRSDGAVAGRYDKIVLVPFGEYIPLGFMRSFAASYSGLGSFPDTTPGREPLRLESAGIPFGTAICFEGVMPGICRSNARNGARFIVNISNDGWFRDSSELDQILVITRFRSIENRVGFVRATNTGISAFIAPDGAVQSMLAAPDGATKEVEGVLADRVTLARGGS
ncbi:MAG TPA: apolipoprotein N-acyltransferase, partial [Planctomycetota bacterium]|nr:apolipoprotein N-acyltransferase [Planctomycetota bacterium]